MTIALGAYRTAGSLLWGLSWPVLSWLASRRGRRGKGWRERMGRPGVAPGAVWIHAASVGEVSAIVPLVRELARRRTVRLAVSVMTPAGKRRARSVLGLPVAHPPLDAPSPVRRWIGTCRPRALLIVETELWPSWISLASSACPVAWVNGRISDRSYPRYLLIRPLIRPLLRRIALLAVISRRDAVRAVRLGAVRSRVRVTGNLKADALSVSRPAVTRGSGPWLAAGSVRPGESRILLEAFRRVRNRFPAARLCLAPRHPGRASEMCREAEALGFKVGRRSSGLHGTVLVLDTIGELPSWYRSAVSAFVGGTLVPIGGHNVLEPALAGRPVLFGPHVANIREEASGLRACGGGRLVRSAEGVAHAWTGYLASGKLARRDGERARRYARSRQGAALRIAALLEHRGIV